MSKKIGLILVRTLGDVVLVHNLVDGIYKKYKDPEVHVFVNDAYKDIVMGNPKIHKVFTNPNWLGNWGAILKLVVSDEYTDVLIPQQLTQEDTIWHQLDHLRHQHLVDYYLTRSRLPKRAKEEKLQLYVTQHDKECIDRILTVNNVEKYVVVHTTSGVPTKDWDYFSEVVHALIDEGISVFQVGLPTDNDANGRGEHNDIKYFDLRGKVTLPQVGVLCKKALCFVGLDSGISFIATSTGVPAVILQGSTVPETSGPFGENVTNILSKTLPQCEKLRCHTNCRYPKEAHSKCINFIKSKEVLNAVRRFTDEEKNVSEK